jgi:hypothetical protein
MEKEHVNEEAGVQTLDAAIDQDRDIFLLRQLDDLNDPLDRPMYLKVTSALKIGGLEYN